MAMQGFQCSAFQQSAFQNDCQGTGGGGEGGAVLRGFVVNILDGGVVTFTDASQSAASAARLTEITTAYHADFVLPLTDSMYVVNYAGGKSIIQRYADETVARKIASYITRDVILPRPENFGVLQLVARFDDATASGARYVTCFVTADGGRAPDGSFEFVRTFAHTFTLLAGESKQQITRLPSGFKARRWRVEIGLPSDVAVYEVNLAGTALELMTV